MDADNARELLEAWLLEHPHIPGDAYETQERFLSIARRIPDSDEFTALETEGGDKVALVLARTALYMVRATELEAGAFEVVRVPLAEERGTVSLSEQTIIGNQGEPRVQRRWRFDLGAGEPLEFETQTAPGDRNPRDEFAQKLAGRLGWTE